MQIEQDSLTLVIFIVLYKFILGGINRKPSWIIYIKLIWKEWNYSGWCKYSYKN